jgi:predicted MFS family arabinose efflux permease
MLATAGVASLVYGFTRAESEGWTDAVTLTMFVVAVVLLAAFVLVESRVRAPLLPLRVVAERTRGGVYLTLALAFVALFGSFLFLTYYFQVVRDYSPIITGLAFLPMAVGMIAGSTQIAPRLLARAPARLVLGPAYAFSCAGMLLLTRLETDSSFVGLVLPAETLIGLGLGMAFMPSMSLATYRVLPRDAGVASAMANTAQQMGAAIGTALLNTIAASATTSYLADHAAEATGPRAERQLRLEGLVHGYTTALWWAAGLLALGSLLAFTVISASRQGGPAAPSGTAGKTADGASAPATAG